MALGTSPTNNKILLSPPIRHCPLWVFLPWDETRMARSEYSRFQRPKPYEKFLNIASVGLQIQGSECTKLGITQGIKYSNKGLPAAKQSPSSDGISYV